MALLGCSYSPGQYPICANTRHDHSTYRIKTKRGSKKDKIKREFNLEKEIFQRRDLEGAAVAKLGTYIINGQTLYTSFYTSVDSQRTGQHTFKIIRNYWHTRQIG